MWRTHKRGGCVCVCVCVWETRCEAGGAGAGARGWGKPGAAPKRGGAKLQTDLRLSEIERPQTDFHFQKLKGQVFDGASRPCLFTVLGGAAARRREAAPAPPPSASSRDSDRATRIGRLGSGSVGDRQSREATDSLSLSLSLFLSLFFSFS